MSPLILPGGFEETVQFELGVIIGLLILILIVVRFR